MKSSTQLPTTTFWRTAAIIVGAAIAAHALLWLDAPLWSQFIAALLITAWLPGFVLARLLLGAPANEFEWLELPLFAVGAGFGVQVVGMTLLSYLPGGIAPWQILLTFDGVTLALLATSWWLERTGGGPRRKSLRRPRGDGSGWPWWLSCWSALRCASPTWATPSFTPTRRASWCSWRRRARAIRMR